MTQFEKLLQQAKTRKEILFLQSCLTDNLTEEDTMKLKAKYLGVSEDCVRFLLAGSASLKAKKWGKFLEKAHSSIIAVIA